MEKFQIYQDGRAAGANPISGSDFVTKDYLSGSLPEKIWIRGTGKGSAVLSGSNSEATGQFAVAEGTGSLASGDYSHAEGFHTTASAQGAHSEGDGQWDSEDKVWYSPVATGKGAHAEGWGPNRANGVGAHAEGYWLTQATGTGSHAEGYGTRAFGNYSHAEGNGAVANGTASHAEGNSTANSVYSHAEGESCKATGRGSHAGGHGVWTSNDYEFAIGTYNVTASGQRFSIGIGSSGAGLHRNAVSLIGSQLYLINVGNYSGYLGSNTGSQDLATVINSLTESVASASYSSTDKKIYFYNAGGTASAYIDATDFIKDGMVDTVTVNTGSGQMIITFNTDAGKEDIELSLTDIFNPNNYYTKTDVDTLLTTMSVGDVNVIEAIEVNGTASAVNNKTASINVEIPDAPNQEAENWVTQNSASLVTESIWVRGTGSGSAQLKNNWVTASGLESVAHGYLGWTGGDGDTRTSTKASGPYSHAEGLAVSAIGTGSHAEGSWSFAQGEVSHAEGIFSHAYGNGSHAEGRGAAYGYCSHAEGYSTAHAEYSHAEGKGTNASGSYSHAEGSASKTVGSCSHAEGYATTASGQYSHAEGQNTTTSNPYEHAQGRWNATHSQQIFSVGVGVGHSSRANAISVFTGSSHRSSSVFIQGIGGYDGTNPTPGTNDLATVISNISASSGGITTETDPIYLADSASLKASASVATSASNWIITNSGNLHTHSNKSLLDSIDNAAVNSWDDAADSAHTHSNKTVLDGITAAKTASWEASGTLAKNLTAISASLIASGTLAKNVTAITASLVASASVAKTASSSAAALSAKSASWDAKVGLPTVTAADNGKILQVVNGAWTLVSVITVYSGSAAPSNDMGNNGDIYLQS